jgi:hypothetical protein
MRKKNTSPKDEQLYPETRRISSRSHPELVHSDLGQHILLSQDREMLGGGRPETQGQNQQLSLC